MIEKYSYGQNKCPSEKANVIERFKKSRAEEIRADLQENRSEAVMICHNLDYNINIGSVIRANNAFLGKEVYVVGRRKIDRRSSVGCMHYENVYHADTFEEVFEHLHKQGYTILAVDNIEAYNPTDISEYSFPRKTAFVFGNEGDGLPEEVIKQTDDMVFIQQKGSVRSLCVAQAAAVALYEYGRNYA